MPRNPRSSAAASKQPSQGDAPKQAATKNTSRGVKQGGQTKSNSRPQRQGNAKQANNSPLKQRTYTAPKQSHEPLQHLTMAWIKAQSKPGNWRRGVELHQAGDKILNMDLEQTGIIATVKGNYKGSYSTKMMFKPHTIDPKCNCAIEDKWCKHAVAVALSIAEQRLWEVFWNLPEEEEDLRPVEHPQGIIKFQLHTAYNRSKGIGLRLIERERDSWCAHPDKLLRRAMTAEFPNGTKWTDVNQARRDIGVLQLLEKHSIRQVSNNGWLLVPFEVYDDLFTMLTHVEELVDEQGIHLKIEEKKLDPVMEINQNSSGQLTLAMHWMQFDKDPTPATIGVMVKQAARVFPLEDVIILDAKSSWGRQEQRIYPLLPAMPRLPKVLKKGTFTDIPMQDTGRFLFDVLPTLQNLILVDETSVADMLKKINEKPVPSLNVEMLDQAAMRLRLVLHFNYDKARVAYTRGGKQEAFVTSTNKKKNKTTWHKRDPEFEEASYDRVEATSTQAMQGQALMAEGDAAVDLYNTYIPRWEKEGWIINTINPNEMGMLQATPQQLVVSSRLEFDESVTYFTMRLEAKLGKTSIPLADVQQHLVAGKKYFYMRDVGFVEVPLHTLLAVSRTLQAFEAEVIERDYYRIPTFKAGLLGEFIDSGIQLDMSKKFQRFWDVLAEGKPMEELKIPDNIKATLRPYQERGFHWLWFLYSYGLNGILADDMGLGKTLQAIVAVQQARNKHGQFPSLIVCPTTLVTNWQNEIKRFAPDLTVMDLTGAERFDLYKEIKGVDIVVTSYAIMRRDINAIKDYPFRFVILDESQQIKNMTSQTALAAKQLQAQHRIALSGTPIENRLAELWSVFDFLMPGFLETYDVFRRVFVQPIEERGSKDAQRRLNKQVSPFILRRMKRDVLKDLPPKMEQVLFCDMTDNQRQLYLDVLEKAREELLEEAIERGGKINQQHVFSALTRLRQVCNHPSLIGPELSGGLHESGKFDALQDLLESCIENGHRILVFSQFVQMLKIVEGHLKRKGINYEILTGATKNRQERVDKFNEDESVKVFLVSLKAGGTGLNLVGADTVIHYDPWWNPAAEDQATDRVHRIGQTKQVYVYRLISRGTVEERIMQLKAQKKDLVDSVISADRTITKKISLDDLKDILSID